MLATNSKGHVIRSVINFRWPCYLGLAFSSCIGFILYLQPCAIEFYELRLKKWRAEGESAILPKHWLTSPHSLLLSARKKWLAFEKLTKRIRHAFGLLATRFDWMTLAIIFFRIIFTTIRCWWNLLQGILVLGWILLLSWAFVISTLLEASHLLIPLALDSTRIGTTTKRGLLSFAMDSHWARPWINRKLAMTIIFLLRAIICVIHAFSIPLLHFFVIIIVVVLVSFLCAKA